MKQRTLATIIIAIAISLVAIWVIAVSVAGQPHNIVFHYTDGTTDDLNPFLSITYNGKSVESVEYKIQGENIELSNYTPYFYSPLGTYSLEPKNGSLASWVIDVQALLYYTLNDGTYTIGLVPAGEIQGMDLPPPITFDLKILDDRSINLVFN